MNAGRNALCVTLSRSVATDKGDRQCGVTRKTPGRLADGTSDVLVQASRFPILENGGNSRDIGEIRPKPWPCK